MNIDLNDLNAAYMSALEGKFPNGIYIARLIKAEVDISKADGRQVVWELEVRDDFSGRTLPVKKYSQLSRGSVVWLVSELKLFSITLDHISELHEALEHLAGATVEIDLENTGDGYVAKFIRLVRGPVSEQTKPPYR